MVRLGRLLMPVGRFLYGSSNVGHACASHTDAQDLKHEAPRWLKNLSEIAFLFVVGYDLYLRPASYNHYTRHWTALLEYFSSYIVLRYAGTWMYRKWKKLNANMRHKLDALAERENEANRIKQ